MSLLIRNGLVVTMNDRFDIVEADVSIDGARIAAVAPSIDRPHTRVVDARGGYVLPGFVQTHVHLCQTLFRGFADDLPLMEWLRRRVWPLEAAHDERTLRAAARLAATELLAGGTTTVLTMETVHDTDAVFDEAAASGLRATIGKCMMDSAGEAPRRLHEPTQVSIEESLALHARWHGQAGGRLRAAFAPRFAVSCTRELLQAVAALSAERGLLVHTHAAESRDEIAIVERLAGGASNIDYLSRVGLASPRLCAAHCVWVDERDRGLLAEHDVKVLHCPSSNLKLGSGSAPIVELRERGVAVSLGADGAACNNRLDMFEEMRLAAMLQAMRRQPGMLTARDALWMATRGGAKAVGLEHDIGSIEAGKRADVIVVDRDRPHLAPGPDPYSTLVYAARASDVRTTVVDGEVLVDAFASTRVDRAQVVADARSAARTLAARAQLS
jgi:5-methylthioadenosine/S-adenosylhomocysteine deaminase